LLVITGPPGAGKSTVARDLAGRFEPSVLVEGDAFFGFLARGRIDPWLPESNEQNKAVTAASATAAATFVTAGYFTVFDGIVGPWFLSTFVAASGLGDLDYAVLLPTVDACVERVGSREDHDFDDAAATRKMHHEFSRGEIDPRHVFVDPPTGADAVADLVYEARQQGRLTYRH
jgi:cytidylate kinase